MAPFNASIHDVLKKYWGYDSFRPLQEEIINSVLSGKDTLGLMPTGGGKSITFQVPGLLFDSGLTIVVTPLVSLMKDQVDNLNHRRIKAVYLHSGMTTRQNRIAWEKIINGRARFLYVSPEKLQNERFLLELKSLQINLITVDEAHCISQWGYDFRPSYLQIKKLRKIKPGVPVLALTATATPEVAGDIMKQLEFRDNIIFKKSFTRDNISYIVRKSDSKINDVLHILSHTTGSSIVYTRSRKRTKEISEFLSDNGISATFYHAGLQNEVKEERQNLWRNGQIRVMVATNAFGMGIDKADVRVVIHYGLPPSLEEYYQEAGRAGRDGLPSYAVILAGNPDKSLLKRRISETFPDRKFVKKIYRDICIFLHLAIGEGFNSVREFDIIKFCNLNREERDEKKVRAAMRLLSQAGYLDFIDDIEKRSRINILSEREELYYLSDVSEKAEKVLAMTLRLYTGLFIDYVYIRESEIAFHTKLSENDVYEALLELDRKKILDYIPKSGLPVIHFPTSREEHEYLIIGKDIYENRKEQMTLRIERMTDYAFSDKSCRVSRMLDYFGETNSNDCGKCDVCREKKKASSQNKKRETEILENVVEVLKQYPQGISILKIERLCGNDRLATAKCLNYLCNEGFAGFKDNLYYYLG